METGEAKIPYKMTAYTKDEPSEKCTEEGFLYIKNSFNAKSTVTSSKSKGTLVTHTLIHFFRSDGGGTFGLHFWKLQKIWL